MTRKGLHRLLRDRHRLAARAIDKGDYDAQVILIDLGRALTAAQLTYKQRLALHYVYTLDMRQVDAGIAMGVSRAAVAQFVLGALKRLTKVYEKWAEGSD